LEFKFGLIKIDLKTLKLFKGTNKTSKLDAKTKMIIATITRRTKQDNLKNTHKLIVSEYLSYAVTILKLPPICRRALLTSFSATKLMIWTAKIKCPRNLVNSAGRFSRTESQR
jgi:hypothetical protein